MKITKSLLGIISISFTFSSIYSQAVYNGSSKHRFTTNYGNIEIGPFNSSWAHIYTNMPKIIFNKDVNTTTNAFSSYNNDLILKTKGTERFRINSTSGNVGIGTTSPNSSLEIKSKTGQTESLAMFRIADAPTDYLQISNTTGAAGQFIPLIKGHHKSDNRYSIAIMGETDDSHDNGTNALVDFDARRSNGPIQNRPLFVWTSYTTKMMTMLANGSLGIGTTTPDAKLAVKGKYTPKK